MESLQFLCEFWLLLKGCKSRVLCLLRKVRGAWSCVLGESCSQVAHCCLLLSVGLTFLSPPLQTGGSEVLWLCALGREDALPLPCTAPAVVGVGVPAARTRG